MVGESARGPERLRHARSASVSPVGSSTLQLTLVPLVERVRRHDEAAFSELYALTHARVTRV